MTANPSQFRYVLTRGLISLSLIFLLWGLIQNPGARVEQAQLSVDTRLYLPSTPDGLSLNLDLKLPQPPLVTETDDQPAGLVFSPPQTYAEPEAESGQWPSLLLVMLLLAAAAAWLWRQRPSSNQTENSDPALQASDTLAPGSDPLFFMGESSEAETVTTEQEFDASIDLLKSHTEKNPGDSAVPWLLLLDLLHRKGDGQEYEIVRKQCRKHFNLNMPAYKKIKTGPQKQGIESYPHIMNKLIQIWSSEEASSYLDALLHDCRDGSRAGFDLATYHDIVLLRVILESTSSQ